MEIKAILNKPYTENERIEFIVTNNHNLGYDVKETELGLEAWGYTEQEETILRENNFKAQFFEIRGFGWYRKTPKGYSSAVESLNTASNIVNYIGKLPANTLIFYETPDFSDPEQCKEEWLVEHQIKNTEMTAQEFGQFYILFMTSWNEQEHIKLKEVGE